MLLRVSCTATCTRSFKMSLLETHCTRLYIHFVDCGTLFDAFTDKMSVYVELCQYLEFWWSKAHFGNGFGIITINDVEMEVI